MTVFGLIVDLPNEKIAIRAVVGSMIAFAASFIALRMAVSVLVQAVIDSDDSIMAVDDDEHQVHGDTAGADHTNQDEADKQLATQE
ncbi:MAG: hypothetical protein GVY16_04745 [Planctomycetes bacterium]|nr:hypothetical protein [Planctomycetota bacterium]